ncbi:hypothetical protein BGZ47_010425 [Haplosporangium gracile]|nr:hypothetical protein BGZ47_010425 [Haplosporangium gracile]
MRRVHPQRAKAPVQSSCNKLSSGGVDNSSVNNESKAWTTHSDLHKRYTANNSDTTLDQAVSHARLISANNSSVTTTTTKKPFMFSTSSMLRHSQEREADAINANQSGTLPLTSRSNNSKNNSGDRGAGGQGRSKVRSRPPIVAICDDDDDDDDFELPEVDELFADTLPRKCRRVESAENMDRTSDPFHPHEAHTKCKASLRKHSHSDLSMGQQAPARSNSTDADPWLMSELQVDQDIDAFTPSPTTKNDNQATQKMPLAMSTRSVVSQTQNTLNEIERLFMDESPTRSPSTRLQTPFGDRELSEQRSPTLHVGATGMYPPDQVMSEPDPNEVVLFDDPQPGKPTGRDAMLGDGQDLGQGVIGDNVHVESRDELTVVPQQDQGVAAAGEQAWNNIERAAEESNHPDQTHTFTLPRSSSAFRDRLKQLGNVFQSSMDDMMDAILDVEQLRTSVEKTLADRQELLNHRGERIHCQAHQLQEEASSLHSKTRENMLRAVHDG